MLKIRSLKTTVSIFLTLSILSGCGQQNVPQSQNVNNQTQAVSALEQMSFDLPTDDASIAYYTDNETLNTLNMAGPYFIAEQESNQPVFMKYEKLRAAKIQEAIKLTSEIVEAANAVESGMQPFRGSLATAFDGALASDQNLLPAFQATTGTLMPRQVKIAAIIATFESMDATVTNRSVAAIVEYEKTALAAQLAILVNEDMAAFTAISAKMTSDLLQSKNTEVLASAKTLDAAMEKIGNINSLLDTMNNKVIELDITLRQLSTAEYYMSNGSLAFIRENLPDIKQKAASLKPGSSMTAENIEFIQGYAELFDTFSADLENQVKETDQSQLITSSDSESFIPHAYASGYFQSAFDILGKTATATAGYAKSAASVAWTGAKKAYGVGKTIYGAAKTTAGVTIDTIGAVAKTGMDVGLWATGSGGNGHATNNTIIGNFTGVYDNYKKGTSGAATLKTAGSYLDSVDQTAKTTAESAVESSPIGKGWISWGAGQTARVTANLFTSFGKGIYKISNTQSTSGQIAEGALDVGLSFIGGSKVLFKGSQVASGSKESLKLLGQKGLNYVEQTLVKTEVNALKTVSAKVLENAKLTPNQMGTLLGNMKDIAVKEGMQAELATVKATLDQKFKELMKEGGSTMIANILESKTAYNDFVKETFKNSLTGVKDAILKVTGDNMKDYMDNLIANTVEDLVKAAVRDAIDKDLPPTTTEEEETTDGDDEIAGATFDGHYTGTYDLEWYGAIPIDITIQKGVLTGSIHDSITQLNGDIPITMTLKTTLTGTIGPDGSVFGKHTGTIVVVNGKKTITADAFGSLSGKIDGENMNLPVFPLNVTNCKASGPDSEGDCDDDDPSTGSAKLTKST